MKTRVAEGLIALCLWAGATSALACGHCVEDRIAAVYDHALVSQAASAGHRVAYFAWDGKGARNDALRQKIAALVHAAGVAEKGAVRVSVEPEAIAVVFDPRRVKPEAVEAAVQARLRGIGLSVTPLEAAAVTGPARPTGASAAAAKPLPRSSPL